MWTSVARSESSRLSPGALTNVPFRTKHLRYLYTLNFYKHTTYNDLTTNYDIYILHTVTLPVRLLALQVFSLSSVALFRHSLRFLRPLLNLGRPILLNDGAGERQDRQWPGDTAGGRMCRGCLQASCSIADPASVSNFKRTRTRHNTHSDFLRGYRLPSNLRASNFHISQWLSISLRLLFDPHVLLCSDCSLVICFYFFAFSPQSPFQSILVLLHLQATDGNFSLQSWRINLQLTFLSSTLKLWSSNSSVIIGSALANVISPYPCSHIL